MYFSQFLTQLRFILLLNWTWNWIEIYSIEEVKKCSDHVTIFDRAKTCNRFMFHYRLAFFWCRVKTNVQKKFEYRSRYDGAKTCNRLMFDYILAFFWWRVKTNVHKKLEYRSRYEMLWLFIMLWVLIVIK